MGNATGNATTFGTVQRHYMNTDDSTNYCDTKIVQNYILVWLDANIHGITYDNKYTLKQLYKVFNSLILHHDIEACKKTIIETRDEQIFLIVSGALGQQIVPEIHKFARVESIYIFCGNPDYHKWTKEWRKIRIVSNQIEPICHSIVQDARQCEYDLTPTSTLSLKDGSNKDFQRIDSSFIYSKFISEIMLNMKYTKENRAELMSFCRKQYQNNSVQMELINEFETTYSKHPAIWWYSREGFTYQMLNRCLRVFDIDIILLMGFFMKAVHEEILAIHSKINGNMADFVVYRGQGLYNDYFDSIRSKIGGFIAFNNFLSTSEKYDVALKFAQKALNKHGKVPVVFEITVDPKSTLAPYAQLKDDMSYYNNMEAEILFSMHTVFQIIKVNMDKESGQIWHIKLASIKDNHLQIKESTKSLEKEFHGINAADQLGRFMITLNHFEKANKVYELLKSSTRSDDKKMASYIESQLGYIQYKLEFYDEAKISFEEALKMQENMNPSSNLNLATTYSYMGLLYTAQQKTDAALNYHQKALEIQHGNLPEDSPDLANTYYNIGLVYDEVKDYAKALEYYEKAKWIYERDLIQDRLSVAEINERIGLVKASIGEIKAGLENLLKALTIKKNILPTNHPSLAWTCMKIGDIYNDEDKSSDALKSYDEALDIQKKISHISHSPLAKCYYKKALVLCQLNEYHQALENVDLAIETEKKAPKVSNDIVEKYEKLREKIKSGLS